MASFIVTSTASAESVGNNDTGVVDASGALNGSTDITWTGGSATPGVTITNDGAITATTRGIDTSGSFSTGSIDLENEAGARIVASGNDAFRINTNITSGTITVDNAGLIVSGAVDASGAVVAASSSGQALDFAAVTSSTAVIDIINKAGAIIGSSDDDAIRPGAGGIISITNDGLIDATASANRAINLNSNATKTSTLDNLVSFTLDNQQQGTIQSQGDAVRITASVLTTDATYNVTVDNAGVIKSTGSTASNNGQAIDFNDLISPLGKVHITNEATGQITAADADAIRAGQNTVIDNYGHITSHNAAGDSGDDGVDFQANGGGIVNNYASGVIEGARHGITGDGAITITNAGSITGDLGSGVNMDTAALSMSYVTNTGAITGHGGFLGGVTPVDGDGVDIDGLITLKNYGTITAAGVHVDGELQEAVTVGGGEIDNYAGGVITSFERAITVDDSNGGPAFAPTTIYNEGLIHGGDGQAISIAGDLANTITNKGTIDGSITTGGGDDTFNAYAGSSVTGPIDLGGGANTLNLLGDGHGSIDALANVTTVNFDSGSWTLGLDSHFTGTIDGFSNLDTLDLAGIGLATGASLGKDGVLTLTGGAGGPFTLQFDPHQSFAGYVFQLSSDGMGGTDVTIAKVINGGNGDDVLTGTPGNDVISGGNGNDTITSGDGNDSLSGGNGDDHLTAGAGNSTLDGGNGDDVLTVGSGNDTLTGGSGADTFVFGPTFGQDVVTDFKSGVDHIEFDGAFANFAAVQAAMHQVGGATVIEVDATHEITLTGVSMASLHASDFIFH